MPYEIKPYTTFSVDVMGVDMEKLRTAIEILAEADERTAERAIMIRQHHELENLKAEVARLRKILHYKN